MFTPEIEDVMRTAHEYAKAICCPLGPQYRDRCINAELHNFGPSIEWLVCATRRAEQDPAFAGELGYFARLFRECARPFPCTEPPPALACDTQFEIAGCPWKPEHLCPDGSSAGLQCDGQARCVDGFDERNCDPMAPTFDCGAGQAIPWLSICDGTRDCANGDDEFRCDAAASGR